MLFPRPGEGMAADRTTGRYIAVEGPIGVGKTALARRLVRELPYLLAEVVYAVEQEMAVTLADVLVRRLRVAYELGDHGRAASRVATAVLAGRLGWDNGRARQEIARYDAEIQRIFGTREPSANR